MFLSTVSLEKMEAICREGDFCAAQASPSISLGCIPIGCYIIFPWLKDRQNLDKREGPSHDKILQGVTTGEAGFPVKSNRWYGTVDCEDDPHTVVKQTGQVIDYANCSTALSQTKDLGPI